MIDFVIYCDTDSNFYSIETFIEHHVGLDKWNILDEETKIQYCHRIADVVSDYTNTKAFKQTQQLDFNSQRKDFKVEFKQEIIARAGLFVAKKHYGLSIVDKEGNPIDELFIRGLPIVQSSTPRAIKNKLKSILKLIISGHSEKDIIRNIRHDRKELLAVSPYDIAVNVGANNLAKYIKSGVPIKGTPGHIRGIHNYHTMLKTLGIESKYEKLGGVGEKVKLVYILQPNRYNIENIGFIRWPAEFDSVGLKIDYEMMIEKFYLNKIEKLLEPLGKAGIVKGGNIDAFFGEK